MKIALALVGSVLLVAALYWFFFLRDRTQEFTLTSADSYDSVSGGMTFSAALTSIEQIGEGELYVYTVRFAEGSLPPSVGAWMDDATFSSDEIGVYKSVLNYQMTLVSSTPTSVTIRVHK